MGDHAARTLLGREAADRVVGTANLERSAALGILGLEKDPRAQILRQALIRQYRCDANHIAECPTSRLDIGQGYSHNRFCSIYGGSFAIVPRATAWLDNPCVRSPERQPVS